MEKFGPRCARSLVLPIEDSESQVRSSGSRPLTEAFAVIGLPSTLEAKLAIARRGCVRMDESIQRQMKDGSYSMRAFCSMGAMLLLLIAAAEAPLAAQVQPEAAPTAGSQVTPAPAPAPAAGQQTTPPPPVKAPAPAADANYAGPMD